MKKEKKLKNKKIFSVVCRDNQYFTERETEGIIKCPSNLTWSKCR